MCAFRCRITPTIPTVATSRIFIMAPPIKPTSFLFGWPVGTYGLREITVPEGETDVAVIILETSQRLGTG